MTIRRPRPLHQWFELRDFHAWGAINAQRAILHHQANGGDVTTWRSVHEYHQRHASTLTVKCARLFDQWNRGGGGLK